MIAQANADALLAAALAGYAAADLCRVGRHGDSQAIALAAAELVGPLLQAATTVLELSGVTHEERGAALRDIIADYLGVRAGRAAPAPGDTRPAFFAGQSS